MATKTIRKLTIQEKLAQHPISTDRIYSYSTSSKARRSLTKNSALTGTNIFTLIEPVRPQITVKLDAYGHPDVSEINLGTQYEHNVTWIHFDLNDLLWQIPNPQNWNPDDSNGYEENYYYGLYIFKLTFRDRTTGDYKTFDFDGIDFRVPKELTQTETLYDVALSIEEYLEDQEEGNHPLGQEIFISDEWTAFVAATFFEPNLLSEAEIEEIDTSQKTALIKPPVDCILADDGYFSLLPGVSNELGIQNDQFIRYIRFNPGQITSHVDEFNIYAVFDDGFDQYISLFERTTDAIKDDLTTPIIAWVPTEVYDSYGLWNIIIVAISKNYKTEDPESPDYTNEFYRFISDEITMVVKESIVTDEILKEEKIDSNYESNFITADEQVIVSEDNAVWGGK